ncbi:MAG: iron-containing redox enzyme family protein [Thermoleophilia bacterium]
MIPLERRAECRRRIESLLERHVAELVACPEWAALESGRAGAEGYDRFLVNVIRTHLKSPQLVAFLYALAPPRSASNLLHNMLEELGLDADEGWPAHPALLLVLARGAGLEPRLPELERLAAGTLRQMVVDPLLYGSLRDVGLAALAEVVAFEFMLSRVSGRIARALAAHRGLSAETLGWFTHHSEVDVEHAAQGLDDLVEYVDYYDLVEDDALTIVEMALRENVFIKRYFGELSLPAARAPGLV